MRDIYSELRSMALNEDKTIRGRIKIFYRRWRVSILAILLLIAFMVASYQDHQSYRELLERRVYSLSTAVLQNNCLVTQDTPVGLVMVADNPARLYNVLTDIAAQADGQRAALSIARKK